MTRSTSRAPRASAASRPAIAARYSASLLVARPMRRETAWTSRAALSQTGAPRGGGAGGPRGPGPVWGPGQPVPPALGLRGLLLGATLPLRHHFLRGKLLAGNVQAEGAQLLLVDATAGGGVQVLLA